MNQSLVVDRPSRTTQDAAIEPEAGRPGAGSRSNARGRLLRAALWAVFALFMAFSIEVVWQYGFTGFLDWALYNGATTLVFVDLAIALTMMVVVMWRDGARHGRTIWPFVALTLAFGSAGPLLYFALHAWRSESAAAAGG